MLPILEVILGICAVIAGVLFAVTQITQAVIQYKARRRLE